MTLRQLPGAIVLGLVCALAAHAALFGGEHAWGGAYHDALLQFTLAAVAGLIGAVGALLWSGARCAADGTVLAVRMRALLPGWAVVAASGAAWFTLGERLEPAHAGVPLAAVIVSLAAAAWLVHRFAAQALRALAGFVFAIAVALDALPHPKPVERPRHGGLAPARAQRDTVWRARLLRAPPVTANA